jgi:hypothetical protein
MRVAVEGVETDEQVVFLEGAQGDQMQGLYFGRPVPASEIAAAIVAKLQQTMHQSLSLGTDGNHDTSNNNPINPPHDSVPGVKAKVVTL